LTHNREQVTESLRTFKSRREAVLLDDETLFEHHLKALVAFLDQDPIAKQVLDELKGTAPIDFDAWWDKNLKQDDRRRRHNVDVEFPPSPDEDLLLRAQVVRLAATENVVGHIGQLFGKYKRTDQLELFRSLFIRPFGDEFGRRLAKAIKLVSPEERAIQAVPIDRIPHPSECRIFLSHKGVDKPMVERYHRALRLIGMDPWLDKEDMPAGTNLERGLLRGFEESCAAVFFVTQFFKDENYLATDIDYARIEKRKKKDKFAIITLTYGQVVVPSLLAPYVHVGVENDLAGLAEILRALPIEAGPVRWKSSVVK